MNDTLTRRRCDACDRRLTWSEVQDARGERWLCGPCANPAAASPRVVAPPQPPTPVALSRLERLARENEAMAADGWWGWPLERR
jgi:hypothetical protein